MVTQQVGCRTKASRSHQHGFTLLEALLAIAVIGIIVGIAYPSYTRFIERSLRADAHAGLLQAVLELERCFSRNYHYSNCAVSSQSPNDNYVISVVEGHEADNGFLVTAVTTRNDGCPVPLMINSLGERQPEACW